MKKILILTTLFLVSALAGAQWGFAAEDTVCIQCHGGLDGRLSAPVEQWQTSVHHANGISCHDCHGGDPTDFELAMSPERGFIGVPEYEAVPDFCGRCHIGVKEDYLVSAHGQAIEVGGAQCVTCHGNHAVQKAGIYLINEESCSRCHDYERAEKVKAVISETEERLVSLEASIASLYRVGIDTEELEAGLFSSRNSFRRVFHSVNMDRIKAQLAEFDGELTETADKVAAYEASLGQRKLVGGVIVLLLLLGGCIAMIMRRSYHQQERDGK